MEEPNNEKEYVFMKGGANCIPCTVCGLLKLPSGLQTKQTLKENFQIDDRSFNFMKTNGYCCLKTDNTFLECFKKFIKLPNRADEGEKNLLRGGVFANKYLDSVLYNAGFKKLIDTRLQNLKKKKIGEHIKFPTTVGEAIVVPTESSKVAPTARVKKKRGAIPLKLFQPLGHGLGNNNEMRHTKGRSLDPSQGSSSLNPSELRELSDGDTPPMTPTPTTEAPTTEAPTTEAPTTEAPNAAVVETPTAAVVATPVPATTEAPNTEDPVTFEENLPDFPSGRTEYLQVEASGPPKKIFKKLKTIKLECETNPTPEDIKTFDNAINDCDDLMRYYLNLHHIFMFLSEQVINKISNRIENFNRILNHLMVAQNKHYDIISNPQSIVANNMGDILKEKGTFEHNLIETPTTLRHFPFIHKVFLESETQDYKNIVDLIKKIIETLFSELEKKPSLKIKSFRWINPNMNNNVHNFTPFEIDFENEIVAEQDVYNDFKDNINKLHESITDMTDDDNNKKLLYYTFVRIMMMIFNVIQDPTIKLVIDSIELQELDINTDVTYEEERTLYGVNAEEIKNYKKYLNKAINEHNSLPTGVVDDDINNSMSQYHKEHESGEFGNIFNIQKDEIFTRNKNNGLKSPYTASAKGLYTSLNNIFEQSEEDEMDTDIAGITNPLFDADHSCKVQGFDIRDTDLQTNAYKTKVREQLLMCYNMPFLLYQKKKHFELLKNLSEPLYKFNICYKGNPVNVEQYVPLTLVINFFNRFKIIEFKIYEDGECSGIDVKDPEALITDVRDAQNKQLKRLEEIQKNEEEIYNTLKKETKNSKQAMVNKISGNYIGVVGSDGSDRKVSGVISYADRVSTVHGDSVKNTES